MRTTNHNFIRTGLSLLVCALLTGNAMAQQLMVVGNDEKISWNDKGEVAIHADEGKDSISIVSLEDPLAPKVIKSFALTNSLFGPPNNITITPDKKYALVANSMQWQQDGDKWKPAPANALYLIRLEGEPEHIATLDVGLQPSGLDINSDGNLLLIGNRGDGSISVLSVDGENIELIDSIDVGEEAAAVSFTPDGKRAFFVKKPQNKVGVLDIDGTNVSYDPAKDINVGIEPYNVLVSPLGDIALVNNIGATGGNDGSVDSVSVIDVTAEHPHVIDSVAVGDGPEGLAFSPDGKHAISVLIQGTQNAIAKPETAWAHNDKGAIALLTIDGKKVRKTDSIDVGKLPEGAVFSDDGQYVYIGNFLDKNVSIIKIDGDSLQDTGKTLELDASPASMH